MKFIRFLLLLLPFACAEATEYSPWFPPVLELQGRTSYLFEKVSKVQTPRGSFKAPANTYSFQLSADLTPWPYWNVEAEVFFTHTEGIAFAYEAALATVRYAWLDDINGDWITLVTGVTLAVPGKRFQRNLNFDYHAELNAEFHVAAGKEWAKEGDWIFRIWALGGYGVANQGSPWIHGLAGIEGKLACLETGFFAEALYGLGSQDLIPGVPFNGYRSINHQAIDIGGYLSSPIFDVGTLSLLAWYNVHAHNFISHYWGAGLSVLLPFNLFGVLKVFLA